MLLPTVLGSVDAALTIVTFTLRFAKHLSPSIKRILEGTEAELGHLDSGTPIGDANKVLIQQLPSYVPASELDSLSWDMNHIMDVMSGVVGTLAWREECGETPGLPRYGDAINSALCTLTRKMHGWGFVFHNYVDLPENPAFVMPPVPRYIEAKHWRSSIRKCRNLLACIPARLRRGHVYYTWRRFDLSSPFFPTSELMMTKLNYHRLKKLDVVNQTIPYEGVENVQLQWYGYGVGLSSYIEGGGFQMYNLTSTDFETLLSGVLAETVQFAGKVKAERAAAEGVLHRVYGEIGGSEGRAKE